MTCAHVLGLIDAGPFADCPRAHVEAAWRHARQCATCGPALEAATALTADLTALPHPVLPRDLTGDILAQIDQIEQVRPAADAQGTASRFRARDAVVWATALGALAVALAIIASSPDSGWTPIDIIFPGSGRIAAGMAPTLAKIAGAVTLAAGLVLYVAGLLAPLGRRSG